MNKVILIGHLGQDPELRFTKDRTAVANATLATSAKVKGTDYTEWHRLVFFKGLAETVAKYLVKGSQVAVEGRIQTRTWTDKEEKKRYTTEIIVDRMQMLGGKRREGAAPAASSPPAAATVNYDDVPF